MMVAGAPAQLHFFFFNDTATTEIYTLSLHDALPISVVGVERDELDADVAPERADGVDHLRRDLPADRRDAQVTVEELEAIVTMGHTSGGSIAPMTRTLRVLRGSTGTPERVEEYRIGRGPRTTVLDALVDVQRTQDPTLAFRYACRVGMCGSCAMVVNGRERWACRTRLP